ncbi:50S ribosomal protein L30 [Chloroflexota bacterium]
MVKLHITWVKSDIGYAKDQRRTLKALGLRRLNQSVGHDDSKSIRGMIAKVRHLVEVEEIEGNGAAE